MANKCAGQMVLDLFQCEPIVIPVVSYQMPCPVRNECGAFMLSDGVTADGRVYARGCNGERGWCSKARLNTPQHMMK